MVMLAVGQAHGFELGPSLGPAAAREGAIIEKRELDVLQRARPGQQVERLKHEPDLRITDHRQPIPVET